MQTQTPPRRLTRCVGIAGLLFFVALAGTPVFAAHTFYLDAVNGNDTTGDGSLARPYKTVTKTMAAVASGDTVLLNSGSYGDFIAGRTAAEPDAGTAIDLFSDWVTFKAAPGQTPHLNRIDLGNLWYLDSGGHRVQLDIGNGQPKGNANCHLRFEGLTIDDGVSILGSRYVEIKACTIRRLGALNGSVDNIEKKCGIVAFYGDCITLDGNEITHVAVGINAAGSDTVIRNNHIHHNSHDGIHVLGGPDWLIEGNRIHDLDDGVDDYQGSDPTQDPAWDPVAGQSWNRHVDGIQIYDLNGDGSDAVVNLTIRGNLFYHLESMGMMLQCKTDSIPDNQLVPPGRFANWVIENNVFGPMGGATIIVGIDLSNGFVLRHNTVVRAPNDSWQSLYRPMHGTACNIQMWAETTLPERSAILKNYRVYNNIFGDAGFGASGGYSSFTSTYGYVGGNFYSGSGGTLSNGDRWYSTLPFETVPGNIQDWIDAGHLPGQLKAGCAAIDAGSTVYTAQLPDDFAGNARDSHPDVGAFEFVSALPTAPTLATQPQSATVAVGASVTFSAFASGTPTPAYQWQKNGVNISGATGTSYTLASVSPGDAGGYTVVATNPSGSVTSTVALLAVMVAPYDAIITITVL